MKNAFFSVKLGLTEDEKMLKMKRDFFDDERIRSVRQYPHGDRYIMIYTMLVGIAERNSRNFALVNEQGKPLTYNEMADICRVNRDMFDKAVILLDANGLIERFYGISYVNTNGLFDETA